MPKQIFKIENFHGGLDSNSDPRDISDGSLSDVSNADTSKLGRLVLFKPDGQHQEINNKINSWAKSGYGLFQFSNDYSGGNLDEGNEPSEVSTHYLALWDNQDSTLQIWSSDAYGWSDSNIIVFNDGNFSKHSAPVFYYADGALRICDGSHQSDSENMVIQYVRRELFTDLANPLELNQWVIETGSNIDPSDQSRFNVGSSTYDLVYSYGIGEGADEGAVGPSMQTIGFFINNKSSDGVNPYSDTGVICDIRAMGGANAAYNTGSGYDGRWPYIDTTYGYDDLGWEINNSYGGFDSNAVTQGSKFNEINSTAPFGPEGIQRVKVGWVVNNLPDSNTNFGGFIRIKCTICTHHLIYNDGETPTDALSHGLYIPNASDEFGSALEVVAYLGAESGTVTFDFSTGLTEANYEQVAGQQVYNYGIGVVIDNSQIWCVGSGTGHKIYAAITDVRCYSRASSILLDDYIPDNRVYIDVVGTEATTGHSQIALSNIYDDEDESGLVEVPRIGSPEEGEPYYSTVPSGLKVNFKYLSDADENVLWSQRVTGFKVYTRLVEQGGTLLQSWKPQLKVDFLTGIYSHWNEGQEILSGHLSREDTHNKYYTELVGVNNTVDTYESETGASVEDAEIRIDKYKTAVVANRVVYIGNVSYGGKIYSDRMIKSLVNGFDTFRAISGRVDVVVSDGDEIIKLETYADRILQFKKNIMYLINISQDIEFLEDEFLYKGVSHPAATCSTDFGIAWVNKNGCYIYDGQKVINLLEKKGLRLIGEDEWEEFVSDDAMIGYSPVDRTIVVVDNCQYNKNRYIYSLITQSWTKDFGVNNLLLNGDFEDWTGGNPDSWTKVAGTGSGGIVVTEATSYAKKGNSSCQIQIPDDMTLSGELISSPITLLPGRTYTLCWWARWNMTIDLASNMPRISIHSPTADNGGIASFNANGEWFGEIGYLNWSAFGTVIDEYIGKWMYYQFTFMVPNELKTTSDWLVSFYPKVLNTTGGYLWIDDVNVVEGLASYMTNFANDWTGELIYGSMYNKITENDVIVEDPGDVEG